MFGKRKEEKPEHPSDKIEPENAAERPENFHPKEFWFLAALTVLFIVYVAYCSMTTAAFEYFLQIVAVVSIWVLIIAAIAIKIKSDLYIGTPMTDDHLEDNVTLLSVPLHQSHQWDVQGFPIAYRNTDTGTRVFFVEQINMERKIITASHNINYTSVSFMTKKRNDIELRKENAWLWDKCTWLYLQLEIESIRRACAYVNEITQTMFTHPEMIKPHYGWKDNKINESGERLPSMLHGETADMDGDEPSREEYDEYRKKLKEEYDAKKSDIKLPPKYERSQ